MPLDAEMRAPLPGDDIVREPLWRSTRAITVNAPPDRVWPWIVQMGYPGYRAGWYTPYCLDRLQWGITTRSAELIVPELQGLAAGDLVPDSRDWSAYFSVVALVPERALVLLLDEAHHAAHALERVLLGVRAEAHRCRRDPSADPGARPGRAGMPDLPSDR